MSNTHWHLVFIQELSVSEQEQLQQRAAYLRQQRDKLLALKKEQQRSRQPSTPEEAPASPAPAPTTPPVNTLLLPSSLYLVL